MIDEQWAVFLAANRFLVGISMDGTKALHDELRPDAFGRSTWARVTKALSLLQKNKVDTNILCVVTRSCAKALSKCIIRFRNLVVTICNLRRVLIH